LLHILTGPDDYSRTQALDELKRETSMVTAFSADTATLDGQQVTSDQLRNICGTSPFLSEKRLVIINGLLERFEPKSRLGRRRKVTPSRQQDSSTKKLARRADEHKLFSACFDNLPDSTVLVLLEGRLTNNNPLFKELANRAVIKSFPLLKEIELRPWIQRRVKEGNGSISPQAVDLLAKLIGSNLWVMTSEINKLVLFTSGHRIEEDDVRALVSLVEQTDVFAMVDAMLECKAETATRRLQQLLQRGAAPTYLLFMLCRQVRLIVRAKELNKRGTPETEIQKRLNLTSWFILRKTMEQAGRYSLTRLEMIYHQLLTADLWIKTGKYGGELTLTILMAELCQSHHRS